MKSPAPIASLDNRRTLLDRFRQGGMADEMIGEMDRRLKKKKRRRRAVVRTVAGALVLIAGLFWAIPFFKDTATISIPVAERRSFALDDGSRVELNANTKLRTDFRYGRRVVRLDQGEGFFSVTSDPQHPFFVETSRGTIRVIGTQFNIHLSSDGQTEVTLIEGKLAVEPASTSLRLVVLSSGDQTTLTDAQPILRSLPPAELDRVLAWRRGKIVLDDVPLTEAAARFGAFHGKTLAVDPSLSHIRLGGTYSLEDLPQFIEALKQTDAVVVLATGNGSYRILPRP